MWKEIPNTQGAYSANSATGEIRSNSRTGQDGRNLKEKVLRPWLINSGYLVVAFRINNQKENHLVHRLMAKTFLEDYSDELDVNHKNLNRYDNSLSNLEMVTRKENISSLNEMKNTMAVHIGLRCSIQLEGMVGGTFHETL